MLGVISDTHGHMRPEALRALAGAEAIIHAGDVGTPEVLLALRQIAPVHAVRGNVDVNEWALSLPETLTVTIGTVRIYVIHDVAQLDFDPAARGYHVVISGHSHRTQNEMRDGVLYLNPGSAGPRRFRLPITLARFFIEGTNVRTEFVELQC